MAHMDDGSFNINNNHRSGLQKSGVTHSYVIAHDLLISPRLNRVEFHKRRMNGTFLCSLNIFTTFISHESEPKI